MKKVKAFLLLVSLTLFAGCAKEEPSGPGEPTYTDLINSGWSAFGQADYSTAFTYFSDAKSKDPNQAEAYAGLGWCLLKQDNLSQASGELNTGSTKTNPSADLFAAWAFVLNAQKSYASSNTEITETLTRDASWNFTKRPQLNLSASDLHVLKSENHFLLGEFNQSLAEVKILNPSFSLSTVTTDADKAALAKEIERLKGIS